MFWVLFFRKYSKLSKFIQKIDPNARMLRIFMDSIDKSALFILCVFSRNLFKRLDAMYSMYKYRPVVLEEVKKAPQLIAGVV